MFALLILAATITPPKFVRFTTVPAAQRGVLIKSFEATALCTDDGFTVLLEVSASYPQFARPSRIDSAVNDAIEESVFERWGLDAAKCTPPPTTIPEEVDRSHIDELCEIRYLSQRFVSIECRAGWDGGAHPDGGVRSLNIDRRSASMIEPAQLFCPGTTAALHLQLRAHAENLSSEETDMYLELDAFDVEGMAATVWFDEEGANFENFHRLRTLFAHLSYSEITPLLDTSVAAALELR